MNMNLINHISFSVLLMTLALKIIRSQNEMTVINETIWSTNITVPMNINDSLSFQNTVENLENEQNVAETVISSNITEHLKIPFIQKICTSDRSVCDNTIDPTEICTMRIVNGKSEERAFKNWCHLFLTNMCDNPGQEYYISFPDNCEKYREYRRHNHPHTLIDTSINMKVNKTASNQIAKLSNITINHSNNITEEDSSNQTVLNQTTKSNVSMNKPRATVLREGDDDEGGGDQGDEDGDDQSTKKTPEFLGANKNLTYPKKYKIDRAWDYDKPQDNHVCPHSCPNDYKPVCLNVNKNAGVKRRFYTFQNHCLMDMYQCQHPELFRLNGDDDDDELKWSMLGMTYCASTRYTEFARFTESISSMGYYGWLAGDYKYSHILKPHERMPGFG